MSIRKAEATWEGDLKDGHGNMKLESGLCQADFSVGTRMEEKPGTNPEELIGAALSGCFSMALSAALSKAGHPPRRIHTRADVHFNKVSDGFKITRIDLKTEADVPGIDESAFREHAEATKKTCPVSKALAATEIALDAKLQPSSTQPGR
jgi:lipoyl-dependent peroxiredoxin